VPRYHKSNEGNGAVKLSFIIIIIINGIMCLQITIQHRFLLFLLIGLLTGMQCVVYYFDMTGLGEIPKKIDSPSLVDEPPLTRHITNYLILTHNSHFTSTAGHLDTLHQGC